MALVRKAQAGSAPGYTWENDGDVLEVDDLLAQELVEIPKGGFSYASPEEAATVAENGADGGEGAEGATKATKASKAAKKAQ